MSPFIPPEGAMQFEVTARPPSSRPLFFDPKGAHIWIASEGKRPASSTCTCRNFFRVLFDPDHGGDISWMNAQVCLCMGRIIE